MQIKMNKNNARSVIFPFTSNYCRGKCCCLNYRNQKKTEKKKWSMDTVAKNVKRKE